VLGGMVRRQVQAKVLQAEERLRQLNAATKDASKRLVNRGRGDCSMSEFKRLSAELSAAVRLEQKYLNSVRAGIENLKATLTIEPKIEDLAANFADTLSQQAGVEATFRAKKQLIQEMLDEGDASGALDLLSELRPIETRILQLAERGAGHRASIGEFRGLMTDARALLMELSPLVAPQTEARQLELLPPRGSEAPA
jgi:aminopeptidase N